MGNSRFLLVILLVFHSAPAYAYLDPGTGSMLLSSLFALMAVLLYSVKNAIYKFLQFGASLFGKKVEQKSKFGLVFYNEGEQYFSTFFPVLRELIKRNVKFTYLYSDPKDTMKEALPRIDALNIGTGNKAFFFLNQLEAKMCVSTTPGLDVLQIKKSKGVQHYCHLHHASRGAANYKVFSFDYYDSNLVPCQDDADFFKDLYEQRNLEHQKLHVIGTPYLELAAEKLQNGEDAQNSNGKINILLSPTWGKDGLLARYGDQMVKSIAGNKNFHLIVRPHPQTVRHEQSTLKMVEEALSGHQNWEWDYSKDNLETMKRADLMISDFSGIILDFIYLFKKPVISSPAALDLDGRDYLSKDSPIWFVDLYEKLTKTVSKDDVESLSEIIESHLNYVNPDLDSLLGKYNPYFGRSGIKAAQTISAIYGELN